MVQIHERIEQARIAAGLTQEEMAQKLNIKRSTYSYWEQKTPGVEKIKAIARVLRMPESYFFGGNDSVVKPKESDTKPKEPKQDQDEMIYTHSTVSSRAAVDGHRSRVLNNVEDRVRELEDQVRQLQKEKEILYELLSKQLGKS